MKTLKDLLKDTPVTALHGAGSTTVAALAYDSRAVTRSDCFFATRCTQSDGHDFIPFGSFHRLPIFWDGRLNAFGREDVTARYAPWEDEE